MWGDDGFWGDDDFFGDEAVSVALPLKLVFIDENSDTLAIRKRNDTLSTIYFRILDNNDVPYPLDDCTLRFLAAVPGSSAVVAGNGVVVDASGGEGSYTWGSTDLNTAGSFIVEVQVTDNAGKIITAPTNKYNKLKIREDLGS